MRQVNCPPDKGALSPDNLTRRLAEGPTELFVARQSTCCKWNTKMQREALWALRRWQRLGASPNAAILPGMPVIILESGERRSLSIQSEAKSFGRGSQVFQGSWLCSAKATLPYALRKMCIEFPEMFIWICISKGWKKYTSGRWVRTMQIDSVG